MRLRDAIKSAEQSEREGIGEDNATGCVEKPAYVKNGGDKTDIWPFVRENRRRMIRVEDRQAIMVKIQLLELGTLITGIGVGLILAYLGVA